MERFRALHKETDYTVIDNGIFKDTGLSYAEIGFLCKILSLPEGWHFNIEGIVSTGCEGRKYVYGIINKLIEHGYCKRSQQRESGGQYKSYDYTFYEVKNGLGCTSEPQTLSRDAAERQTDSRDTAKDTLLSTKDIKYLKNKVKNNNPPLSPFDFLKALRGLGVTEQLAREWMAVRKTKRLTNTRTAFDQIAREIAKTGRPATDCVRLAVENSWGGFKAEWMKHETQHVTLDNLDETIRRLNDGTYTG